MKSDGIKLSTEDYRPRIRGILSQLQMEAYGAATSGRPYHMPESIVDSIANLLDESNKLKGEKAMSKLTPYIFKQLKYHALKNGEVGDIARAVLLLNEEEVSAESTKNCNCACHNPLGIQKSSYEARLANQSMTSPKIYLGWVEDYGPEPEGVTVLVSENDAV